MSTGSALKRVLEILLKYAPAGESVPLQAKYNELLIAGPEPDKLTKEDREELEAMNVGYDESWEGWSFFT